MTEDANCETIPFGNLGVDGEFNGIATIYQKDGKVGSTVSSYVNPAFQFPGYSKTNGAPPSGQSFPIRVSFSAKTMQSTNNHHFCIDGRNPYGEKQGGGKDGPKFKGPVTLAPCSSEWKSRTTTMFWKYDAGTKQIKNTSPLNGQVTCLSTTSAVDVHLNKCSPGDASQQWMMKGHHIMPLHYEGRCLQPGTKYGRTGFLSMDRCKATSVSQMWAYSLA